MEETKEPLESTQEENPDDELLASEVGVISQWQLMWIRFRKNLLARFGVGILVILYICVALAPFLSPVDFQKQDGDNVFSPPSTITLYGPDGRLGLQPYTYAMSTVLNTKTFKFEFVQDKTKKNPIQWFVKGDPYRLFGLFETNVHLFGVESPQRIFIFGADALGRDIFARVLTGGQVSMTIGLVGVALTILFGSVLGTASGYFGGRIDDLMQRIIEIIASFPTVPLWAALAAALPPISSTFTGLDRYFLITVILSLVGWTGLARQVRGKVLSYRRSDFTSAAIVAGARHTQIIFTHMIPNAASHIIVVAAMAIPGMILGETALSFLGLGILPPMVSWGSLLREAQRVTVIINNPWLILPGVFVVLAVLGFSFLGDAIRDAVDPYSI
jgi:peptide/nickel transport system permease protein